MNLPSPCEDPKAIREDHNAQYKQLSQNPSPAPKHGFAVGAKVIQDQAFIHPAKSMIGWNSINALAKCRYSAQQYSEELSRSKIPVFSCVMKGSNSVQNFG